MPAKKKGLKIEPMTAEQEEWADEVKAQLDVLKNEKIQMKVERASAKGKDSLNLHDKRLNGVPEDIANIPNCKSIILSKNNLEELPESLYHIASLEKLDLSGNHFQKLPDEISHLPKLRELYLQNNKLIAIPSTVSELRGLEHINVNNNLLAELPPTLCENKLLKSLECKDNGLTLLPEGEWCLLTRFNAMKNCLVALPATLGSWLKIQHLNLAENKVGELPEDIGNCFNLQELNLTGNGLIALPESFANLVNLRELHLGRNSLKNDALAHLVNMKELTALFLYKNKFTTIPAEFHQFRKLVKFSIANNGVKSIPGALGCWADAITEAHFSHNDIAEVPMSLGAWWKLKEFTIAFNPRLLTLPKSLAENRGLLQMDLREVNPEFVLPKELQNHPRCQFKGVKIKGKGKKKKK